MALPIYDEEADFWENYRKSRPAVPDSFFNKIFDYHQQHGGSFELAHDVGAGPGVHSARLKSRFKTVKVSDVSEKNIKVAKSHLHGYDCQVSSIEDLKEDSNDLVFASTCLHWTKITSAIQGVHRNLKPGGTFAASVYGPCVLTDTELNNIWIQFYPMLSDQYNKAAGGFTPQRRSNVEMASLADALPLPEAQFDHVERIKMNDDTGNWLYSLMIPPGYDVPKVSNVKPNDSYTMVPVTPEWTFHKSLAELKQILDTFPLDQNDSKVQKLWQELGEKVGDKKVEGVWPADLVLSRKIA